MAVNDIRSARLVTCIEGIGKEMKSLFKQDAPAATIFACLCELNDTAQLLATHIHSLNMDDPFIRNSYSDKFVKTLPLNLPTGN